MFDLSVKTKTEASTGVVGGKLDDEMTKRNGWQGFLGFCNNFFRRVGNKVCRFEGNLLPGFWMISFCKEVETLALLGKWNLSRIKFAIMFSKLVQSS